MIVPDKTSLTPDLTLRSPAAPSSCKQAPHVMFGSCNHYFLKGVFSHHPHSLLVLRSCWVSQTPRCHNAACCCSHINPTPNADVTVTTGLCRLHKSPSSYLLLFLHVDTVWSNPIMHVSFPCFVIHAHVRRCVLLNLSLGPDWARMWILTSGPYHLRHRRWNCTLC